MLRLIEYFPSWEVHALLRFCDVSYRVDCSPLPTALGRKLPIIIDDECIYQGSDIFECIQRHSRRKTVFHEEEIDELVSSAIRQRLEDMWFAVSYSSGYQRDQAMRASPFGLNFYVGQMFDLQSMFVGQGGLPHCDKKAKVVEDKLIEQYMQINSFLDKHPHSSISFCWPFIKDHFDYFEDHQETRNLSDALLFGYIARALTHPALGKRVSELDNLMKFFISIATSYFQNHDSSDENGTWKMSLYRLLKNPHVYQNPDYAAMVELISFDNVNDYATMSYPVGIEDKRDEPTDLAVLSIPSIQELKQVKPFETDSISIGGCILSVVVAMSFGSFLLNSRLR